MATVTEYAQRVGSRAVPRRAGLRADAIALGAVVACLVVELALLPVGLDVVDEGYFAEQATRVVRGEIPYRDFESLYTPGLVYLHAAVFGLQGGPHIIGLRLLAWLGRAALALGLYALARPLARPLWAALPALVILLGIDLAPSYWFPHPGWLSAAGTLMATWVFSRLPEMARHQRAVWLFLMGILTALVFALKQNAGVFLGLSAVMFLLLRGLDVPPPPISPVLRVAQLAGLGGLLAALVWLMRPHLDLLLVGYLVAPVVAVGLLLVARRVSSVGEPLRGRLDLMTPLAGGFCLATAPWLIPIVLSMDGHVERLSGFVGSVERGVFDPLVLPGKVGAAVVGCGLVGVAAVRLGSKHRRSTAFVGAGLLLLLLLVRIARPDLYATQILVEAPWRAGMGVMMLLPSAGFLGGIWLARRWGPYGRRTWLLQWYLAAGVLTFLTEYPIVDVVHLAWSAGMLLVVGASVLDEVHTSLASRWRLTFRGRAALAAALVLVPAVAASAQFVDWRALDYITRDEATGLPQVRPLMRLATVRYAEQLWVSPDVRDELISLLDQIQQTTAPGEPIFVYPVSPLIYVLAERPNPTRYGHLYPGTIPRAELLRLVDTLEERQVQKVVISRYSLLQDRSHAENAIVEDYLRTHFQESWRSDSYRILQRHA